jgi:hypothetical protein
VLIYTKHEGIRRFRIRRLAFFRRTSLTCPQIKRRAIRRTALPRLRQPSARPIDARNGSNRSVAPAKATSWLQKIASNGV